MGFVKNNIDSSHIFSDKKVCFKCFNNTSLQDFIKFHSKTIGCDFCKSRSRSHELADVLEHIYDCINDEYEDPVNSMGWDSQEGGYHGAATYDSYELLDEIGLDVNSEALHEEIVSNLENDLWCEKEPYQLRYHEEYIYDWKNFCNLVKYKCRYMFLEHEEFEEARSLSQSLVSKILHQITELFKTFDLIQTLPMGTVMYRARSFNNDDNFKLELKEICTPPEGVPRSSRMSAAGIPIFYGAKNRTTALREIRLNKNDKVVIGRFRLMEKIKIIDLTKIPQPPCFFSLSQERVMRSEIIFLNNFLNDFTKPIEKDGREHIDYVPTQIIAEFVKYKMKKNKIKGFAYPSSQHKHGISYCLFVTREECGVTQDLFIQEKQILELINKKLKVVSV